MIEAGKAMRFTLRHGTSLQFKHEEGIDPPDVVTTRPTPRDPVDFGVPPFRLDGINPGGMTIVQHGSRMFLAADNELSPITEDTTQ